ncbi:hypothetical protein B1J94_19510, partial [Leptospira kirschneri serovar Grippotyphosa]
LQECFTRKPTIRLTGVSHFRKTVVVKLSGHIDDIEAYKNALPESRQLDFIMIHGYNISCYKDELLKKYKQRT